MASSDDVHRDLPVKLTEPELLAFGDEMADCEMRIGTLKLKRKELNAKITVQRDERKRLAKLVDDGTELRKVVCRWVEDVAHQCKRLVRQDTGDVVDTQALTADDLQEDMFGDEDAYGDEGDDGEGDESEPRSLRAHVDPEPLGLHDEPEGPEDDESDLDDEGDEDEEETAAQRTNA
jgi:hypothetical protein